MEQYNVGQKLIKVGTEDQFIKVKDIYAYTYDAGNGKIVLRATLDANTYTFEDIKRIFDGRDIYEYNVISIDNFIETNINDPSFIPELRIILSNEYHNFCKNFECSYAAVTNDWNIEITKKLDEEVLAENNANEILNAYEALVAVYELQQQGE